MKIQINQTTKMTIEVPKYFRSKKYPNYYFMTWGEESAVRVVNYDIAESLILYPSIDVVGLKYVSTSYEDGIEPISEADFKHVFIKVSLLIENLMN
jgi:hypothetical protein